MTRTLDEHGIVMRGNDGTSESITTVKADAVATGRSIDFDLSSVRRETFGRVFGSDTALNSKPTCRDFILGKAELL